MGPGERKSPTGSRDRAPMGSGGEAHKPEANANFQLSRGTCTPLATPLCVGIFTDYFLANLRLKEFSQEILADAKISARQQCVYEDP